MSAENTPTTPPSDPKVELEADNEEDEFEDAPSTFQRNDAVTEITHEAGMETITKVLNMMLNNQYFEAEAILKPWADVSPYHCVGYGTIVFCQAMMSFEPETIELASSILQDAVALLNTIRKKQGVMESLSGMVFGQKMDSYTTAELHAEIFYAECNMLQSLLTFFQDESLMSFIKGGLKIRQCYSMYKNFYSWVESSKLEGVVLDPEFIAGVQLGIGCFNLIISLLPQRILKLLEFVGFSGNQLLGLQELTNGARSQTIHSSMCTSFILFYHTVASVMLGLASTEVDHADGLLQLQMERHPNCLLYLYFKGRIALLRGNVDEAITWFNKAMAAQDQWKKVHHLCYWELKWCYVFKGQYAKASHYADILYRESRWSKSTFLYQKAAFQLMLRHKSYLPEQVDTSITMATDSQWEEIMREIPTHKQRIAGKSIPVEKFVIAKAERSLEGARLPLCGLEMVYAWNGFQLLSKNKQLLESVLRIVWDELMTLEELKDSNKHYIDDWSIVTLIQGVCFKGLERFDEAQQCFEAVINRSGELQVDHYTAPAAQMELGLLHLEKGDLLKAEKTLETAKTAYKGYHLESRIHFRIHAGLCRISHQKT
ncbi:PREDICTED: tetratricopeptide repeat protein 39B-like [Amphimedon queenslandica]|uniref:Tetratricopeptide repeat protein 39B n=1 Tax=Amphimedon queenslandica TaxID=400682 RepID=A0A1X7UD30_AMPQE|nr:PREDICTED: tetratricopeptide repeat protein 39B-like [Amphimedon queenslandica]|eukprot:XP_019855051.1 PREDICTED: tetratricopeptide repeat protein 39B-like [Amphimedon queenslandica]